MSTLPTDGELVDAAAATYVPNAIPVMRDNGSTVRIFQTMRPDGLSIFAIEGTHDPLGWAFDFCALAVHPIIDHSSLGIVHAGFYALTVPMMSGMIDAAKKGPYAICGHSLGGAIAILMTGLLVESGFPPVKLCAFAPPRVGGVDLLKVTSSVPQSAYRFGLDVVPTVPFTLPDFPYLQVALTEIGKETTLGPFAAHHITNYVKAVHQPGEEDNGGHR